VAVDHSIWRKTRQKSGGVKKSRWATPDSTLYLPNEKRDHMVELAEPKVIKGGKGIKNNGGRKDPHSTL